MAGGHLENVCPVAMQLLTGTTTGYHFAVSIVEHDERIGNKIKRYFIVHQFLYLHWIQMLMLVEFLLSTHLAELLLF